MKTINILKLGILSLLSLYLLYGCNDEKNTKQIPVENYLQIDSVVTADAETEAVVASTSTDAADDPSIWINYNDPESSLLVCTNKQKGLDVFNLDGKKVFSNDAGKINNVDIRYNFPLLDGSKIDIVAGSNRSNNSISIFKINTDGSLDEIHSRILTSNLREVYGFCLYYNPEINTFYAFVNGKSGGVEQWELMATEDNKIDGKIVRTLKVDSQTEGSVCDDELGIFYLGEENNGIWRFSAKADADSTGVLIADLSNPALEADIEGLALYVDGEGKGYLIASSQGSNSYAIFKRDGNNDYLGSFTIGNGNCCDRTSETDGIDASSFAFGTKYPDGIFVAQDDANFDGDTLKPQNFKLVSWSKIANLFNPPLTTYKIQENN